MTQGKDERLAAENFSLFATGFLPMFGQSV